MEHFVAALNSLSDEEKTNLIGLTRKITSEYSKQSNNQNFDFDMKKQLQIWLGFD